MRKPIHLILSLVFLISVLADHASADIERFEQSDTYIWHGSQPESEGDFKMLQDLGVKVIVNMRWDESVATSKEADEQHGFEFVNVPIVAMKGPTDDDIAKIFAVLQNSAEKPVYFHCTLGRDRTGLIASLYAVRVLGQSPQEAYDHWTQVLGFKSFPLTKIDRYFKSATEFQPTQTPGAQKTCDGAASGDGTNDT